MIRRIVAHCKCTTSRSLHSPSKFAQRSENVAQLKVDQPDFEEHFEQDDQMCLDQLKL